MVSQGIFLINRIELNLYKIWNEDANLKTPIIRTRYHNAYLSDGTWSPSRPGVFFVTRRDGWMDVWDYFYRQNEIAFSHKVSDAALTCIKINTTGGNSLFYFSY